MIEVAVADDAARWLQGARVRRTEEDVAVIGAEALFTAEPAPGAHAAGAVTARPDENEVARDAVKRRGIDYEARHAAVGRRVVRLGWWGLAGLVRPEADTVQADLVIPPCKRIAINIEGGGGGYDFYGGQIGGQDFSPTLDDDRGIVTIGKQYIADGSGAIRSGAVGCNFFNIGWEGWKAIWAIRCFGEVMAMFHGCSFNATANVKGERALGILKMHNPLNSRVSFNTCAGGGHYSSAGVLAVTGARSDGFMLHESCWYTPPEGGTVSDRASRLWMHSGLGVQSSGYSYGAFLSDAGLPTIALGGGRIRWNGNEFQKSNDRGATWTTL